MMLIVKLFFLCILQNASFTLVSRARNSSSIWFHAIAAVLSNGIWLLVIREVVVNVDSVTMMITYVVGAVIGSISMHYVSMKYFEKPKKKDIVATQLSEHDILRLKRMLDDADPFPKRVSIVDKHNDNERKAGR